MAKSDKYLMPLEALHRFSNAPRTNNYYSRPASIIVFDEFVVSLSKNGGFSRSAPAQRQTRPETHLCCSQTGIAKEEKR